MKLTIIGCSGSMSGPESSASSYLLQATGVDEETGLDRRWSIVLDIGPGSFGQLWRYLDPREVDAVLISHGHPDHMADVISLQVFLTWHPEGRAEPIKIAGPDHLPRRIGEVRGFDAEEKEAQDGPWYAYQATNPGTPLQIGPFNITAYPGLHTVESYGFRIEGPSDVESNRQVVFAYTGDTDLCDPMYEMARDVDFLLSECGFTREDTVRGIHLTGTRAAELARDSGARKLVLTHVQPWTNPEVPAQEAAEVLGFRPEVASAGATWVI